MQQKKRKDFLARTKDFLLTNATLNSPRWASARALARGVTMMMMKIKRTLLFVMTGPAKASFYSLVFHIIF